MLETHKYDVGSGVIGGMRKGGNYPCDLYDPQTHITVLRVN